VNQEESEQNEVDGMKKGADSTCKVMSTSALQQVFRAVFFSKLTYIYATLAWRGFTTSTDRQGIDAVLRRANKSGFWTSAVSSDFPAFEDLQCAHCRRRTFYRAMHFSAKRGIAIACRLSVRPSVCDVGEL